MVDHNALNRQFPVVVLLNFNYPLEQPIERTTGEIIAVKGDQTFLSCDEGRKGIKIEGGRCIDENLFIFIQLIESILELSDLVP